MKPIQHGMFIMPCHPVEKPLAQSYDEDLELIVRAEELGFHDFWIGEHHSSRVEQIVMPEAFIARALADTNTIRLGAAPTCVNLHHPAHVASRMAFLDHLSKGRINLCFGPNSLTTDSELYGLHPKDGAPMAAEAVNMILKLWASDPPYEIKGKYWDIRLKDNVDHETHIGFIHKPYQRPHPPIWVPGTSRNSPSMRMAGAQGFRPICHCVTTSNVLADCWKNYEQAALSAGHQPQRSDWQIARAIYLADTTREARERARHGSLGKNFEYIGIVFDRGLGRDLYKRNLSMSDADCNLDFLMEEQIIAGDVDEVLRRLLLMIEETGTFGSLILMSYDWDNKASWLRSMELFAEELMPALNKAIGCLAA